MPARKTNDRIEASEIHPVQALQYGYSLYLRATAENDPVIHERAVEAVEEFERLCTGFTRKRDRMYILALKQSALNLARGIERKKSALGVKLEAIEAERRLLQKRMSQGITRSGLLRAGVKLLALGGATFLAVQYLKHIGVVPRAEEGHTSTLPMASALAVMLFGSFAQSWLTDRRVERMFRNYNQSIRKAEKEYADSVRKEYLLSVAMAEDAWSTLTGEPEAPGADGFHALVLDMMNGRLSQDIGIELTAEDQGLVARLLGA